jgi:hypothetical protein
MTVILKKSKRGRPPQHRTSPEEAYAVSRMSNDQFLEYTSFRDPVIFAENNLSDEQGDPLDYSVNHEFLKQYLRDFSSELCVIKSSQTGITTSSIVKCLYLANIDQSELWGSLFGRRNKSGIRIIYTFPTERDVGEFSSTRFRPMIQNSERLVKMIGRGIDASLRRRIGRSIVSFRGTQSERQAISTPADLIVTDELDFSDQVVVDAFDSRLSHSDLRWWWKFSTPTIPNYGIDAEYQKSNQYRWIVKCQHCGRRQQVMYPTSVKKKRVGKSTVSFWGCRSSKCGKELDRTQGVWVPKYENRDYHGYYIPPSICPWIQPSHIESSRKRYRTEKGFMNYALGRAYSTGEDVITRELLLNRIEFGEGYHPIFDNAVYMGVDQGDILHFTISRSRNNRRETIKTGTRSSFAEIGALMNEYHVKMCYIDGMPNKKSAQDLASDFYGRVKLVFYHEFIDDDNVRDMPKLEHGVTVDRTGALDMSAESWRSGRSVMVLDRNIQSIIPMEVDNPDGDGFIQQMGNMTRDEEENVKTGKVKYVWRRTGPDHFRHADSYCFLAWQGHQGGDISDLLVKESPSMMIYEGERPDIGGVRSTLWTPF